MSAQLWDLRQLGYPEEVLVEVVRELADVGHSSRGVEQSHAAAAQVLTHHPEMFDD